MERKRTQRLRAIGRNAARAAKYEAGRILRHEDYFVEHYGGRVERYLVNEVFWNTGSLFTETCPVALKRLLHAGAKVNASMDAEGRTPLMIMSGDGHVECVRIMLAAGADVNWRDEFGWTATMHAAARGHSDCVKALISAGAAVPDPWTLSYVATAGHTSVIKPLVDAGVAVDSVVAGCTALMRAAISGHVECVEELIRAGANVNIQLCGRTALIGAATFGFPECVRALVKAGAALEAMGYDGRTPLNAAAYNGHKECASALLEAGASANTVDMYGYTALINAAYRGHVTCVEALVSSSRTRWVQKAMDAAVRRGHLECVKALLEGGRISVEGVSLNLATDEAMVLFLLKRGARVSDNPAVNKVIRDLVDHAVGTESLRKVVVDFAICMLP